MKLILATAIFLCFVFLGCFYFKKFLKKQGFYSNLSIFLQSLKTEIGFFQNEMKQILDRANYAFEFQTFLSFFKEDKLDLWQPTFLKEQEIFEIKNFFKKLGRADVMTESKEIETFSKHINQKLQDIKQTEHKKMKMCFSLIIMLGLLVFLIII